MEAEGLGDPFAQEALAHGRAGVVQDPEQGAVRLPVGLVLQDLEVLERRRAERQHAARRERRKVAREPQHALQAKLAQVADQRGQGAGHAARQPRHVRQQRIRLGRRRRPSRAAAAGAAPASALSEKVVDGGERLAILGGLALEPLDARAVAAGGVRAAADPVGEQPLGRAGELGRAEELGRLQVREPRLQLGAEDPVDELVVHDVARRGLHPLKVGNNERAG